jgi:hypothetical protein
VKTTRTASGLHIPASESATTIVKPVGPPLSHAETRAAMERFLLDAGLPPAKAKREALNAARRAIRTTNAGR